MNSIPILSICITSYNRPNELYRCLKSIDVSNVSDIEIVISEDKSPKREEIRTVINQYCSSASYNVIVNYNEVNLGYDRNLGKLISLATGKYILFCSDDDAFYPQQLDSVIDILKKNEIPLLLTSYSGIDNYAFNRRYNRAFRIPSGINSIKKHLYDGILFSGLLFKASLVKTLDSEPFVNHNYFQIYLLMKILFHYGGAYEPIDLINCIMDGENGYGTTELSNNDALLADRNSLYSNAQFNKGLIKVIRYFDKEEKTNIIKWFSKEYSLKTYRGLSRARKNSRGELKKYWIFLHELDLDIVFPANFYYVVLYLLNSEISDKLFLLPKKILFKIRRNGYK